MVDFFRDGGFFMWPILLCAFLAVGLAVQHLFRPHQRLVTPVLFASAATLISGLLGFTMAVVATLGNATLIDPEITDGMRVRIALQGTRESAANLELAFLPLLLVCVVMALSTWRVRARAE